MKTTYTHLLFDLDGTLTDPMEGITRSVQYSLRHFGIEVTDLRSLTPFIGPPLAESFREFYGFDDGRIPEAIRLMREYFSGALSICLRRLAPSASQYWILPPWRNGMA